MILLGRAADDAPRRDDLATGGDAPSDHYTPRLRETILLGAPRDGAERRSP